MPAFGKLKASEMSQWIERYNSAGIDQSQIPPIPAAEMAASCNAIVCSNLPRSIESAEVLKTKTGHIIHSDAIFREMDLPYATWHLLRLPPAIWLALFRILWFFGFSPRCESYKAARNRAISGAQRLKDLATEHESVLLVGHGLINRFIAKELLSTGWHGPANPGKQYWGFSVYECIKMEK